MNTTAENESIEAKLVPNQETVPQESSELPVVPPK